MNHSMKSRKILAFGCVTLAVIALVCVAAKVHAPDSVTIQALWVIGFAGLFTIGGQSLVDSITKWKGGA